MAGQLEELKIALRIKLKDINTYQYIAFTILFARMAVVAINYGNATASIFQYLAFRESMVILGIIVLINLSRKQLLSWINLILLLVCILGSIATYHYNWTTIPYQIIIPQAHLEELDPWFLEAFLLGSASFYIWGVILIATIRKGMAKGLGKMNLPFILTSGLLLFFMMCFRYDKSWVFFFLGPLALFYLQNYSKKASLLLIKSMSSGLVISFIYVVAWALKHRMYDQSRYTGFFVNPSNAGIYYGMVAVIIFIMTCNIRQEKKHIFTISKLIFTYLMLGIALCFVLYSGSRTAMLATVIAFLGYYILLLIKREHFWKLTGRLLLIVVIMILCINPVFLALRYIPSYFNEPVIFEAENQYIHNMILKDDPKDSYKYTTQKEFFLDLAGKFGIELGDILNDAKLKKHEVAPEKKENQQGEVVTVSQNEVELTSNTEKYVQEDVTNGRTEIYTTYLDNLNLVGHELGYINLEEEVDENGNKGPFYWHAHNTFLQMAYEFGIGGGIAFILFIGVGLFCSIKRYWTGREEYLLVPFMLGVYFIGASITEWVGFPMIPLALFFYLSLVTNVKEQ